MLTRIVITLEYDVEETLGSLAENESLTKDEIVDRLEDDIYQELTDLMRTTPIKYWANITLED